MKQNLLNKLWLRVGMIVAVMTTALAGTAWAQGDYSTDYTGNVKLSTTGGTSASACVVKIQQGTNTVNSYDGIKAGTSSKAGAVKITVPSGTKYLHLHTAAWNNESVTLAVSPSVYSDEISLTSDSGVSGNSPFTLGSYNKAPTDYYKVITFDSALTEATDLTFTATSGKRFVVWGVTAEDEGSALAVATSVVISDKAITNTDVYVSDEAGSLSATVVAGETTLSGATVTWSGNNDAVAIIDTSTGAVTLVGAGVVTFTAAYAGVSGEYKASSANYEMTVTDSTPLTGGDVTFDAKADKGNTAQGAGSIVKNGVTFYCSNGILGNGSEYRIYKNAEVKFTLSADAVASGYVIKSIAFTCTSSNPASGFADQEGWTTNVSDGTWTGAAASVSFTASGAQVRATTIVVTVGQQAALASIEVSGDYPTSFHAGDAFSHEGIVVTATYDDSTTRDVTALATFSEPDMTSVGIKTVTVSYSEGEVTETTTYQIAVNAPATLVSISLSGTYPTEFGQGDAFSSEGIVVTANYDDNTTADVTAEATFSGYDMNALGEQTVTVSYEGKEATYTINVVEKKGTATNPYTVAEAVAYIGTLGSATSATEIYVSGIISQVDSFNSKYGSITYWISDDGTTEGQMEVYSGLNINGEQFSAKEDLQVGDIVTVKGFVKMYNTTPEFDKNNQLVSFVRPVVTTPSINLGENEINAFAQGSDGVIIVGYENITTVVAEVFFCDADGNAATYDWVAASINDINNLEYIIDANTSTDARTAYMKVHALDDDANDVYSELITINQAGVVVPVSEFATLPFAFDGVRADIEDTDGLTQDGLGTDYKNSPYLKFDGSGDYVVLAFDERPGVLTFNIQGNSFSGGTFQVQASEDGVEYGTVATYTELGTLEAKTISDLGEDIRYIKWIYKEKVSGNVALGGINLAKYEPVVPVPTLTVTPTDVAFEATNSTGVFMASLDIAYSDIVVDNYQSFSVQFYDENNVELSEAPTWLVVGVAGANDEGYQVQCETTNNDGAERTAYFKVYALDNDANLVYSELVTVTQAAYVEIVPGSWVETALADITDSDLFVIVGDNGDTYAMSNDKGTSSAPTAVAVTVAGNTLSGDIPTNIQWKLSVETDGYTFYPSGDAENWLYCNNSNNGVRVGTSENSVFSLSTEGYLQNNATSRYLGIYNSQDWRCYTNTTGNIAGQTFKFYKKIEAGEEIATVGAAGYATYVTKSAVAFPSTVTAYIAAVKGEYVALTEVTAVPAGTAVVLKGQGTHTLTPATTVDDVTANELKASDGTVVGDGTIFVLAKPAGEEVGFYAVETGSTIAEGKAYLQASGAGVKGFTFIFNDDATGINDLKDLKDSKDLIFNLAGQRIQKLQRGINIVGGKKVMVK